MGENHGLYIDELNSAAFKAVWKRKLRKSVMSTRYLTEVFVECWVPRFFPGNFLFMKNI